MRDKTNIVINLFTLIAFIIGALVFKQSDRDIVIHWNAQNQGDGLGPRYLLLIFPLIIPFTDTIIRLCRRIDPQRKNYDKFASSLATVRLSTAALLGVCCLITDIEAWRPHTVNVSLLVYFSLGVMISVCGNIMPRLRPNYMIGIRNPWTLHDETIWRKTHRFCGWIWFGSGILFCTMVLWQPKIVLFTAWLITIILLPNLYSYLLYRRSIL